MVEQCSWDFISKEEKGDKHVDIIERMREYNSNVCWQYDMRIKNLTEDLAIISNTFDVSKLDVSDFEFKPIIDKPEKDRAKSFIVRYEWLGNISQYPTHWFGAYYRDILAGVIIFNVPNAFSKLLGDKTKDIERLLSRGACISWSPKGLASAFVMWCIRWMAKNTQYRLFTAYSDPTANEIGTIYQACNFYYLGKKAGTNTRYINPYTGRIVSDRFFRQKSAYKKYANELGIQWDEEWLQEGCIAWDRVPDETEIALRKMSRDKMATSEKVTFPSKHKYAYVLGANKRETNQLRNEFLERIKTFEYPKRATELS